MGFHGGSIIPVLADTGIGSKSFEYVTLTSQDATGVGDDDHAPGTYDHDHQGLTLRDRVQDASHMSTYLSEREPPSVQQKLQLQGGAADLRFHADESAIPHGTAVATTHGTAMATTHVRTELGTSAFDLGADERPFEQLRRFMSLFGHTTSPATTHAELWLTAAQGINGSKASEYVTPRSQDAAGVSDDGHAPGTYDHDREGLTPHDYARVAPHVPAIITVSERESLREQQTLRLQHIGESAARAAALFQRLRPLLASSACATIARVTAPLHDTVDHYGGSTTAPGPAEDDVNGIYTSVANAHIDGMDFHGGSVVTTNPATEPRV